MSLKSTISGKKIHFNSFLQTRTYSQSLRAETVSGNFPVFVSGDIVAVGFGNVPVFVLGNVQGPHV